MLPACHMLIDSLEDGAEQKDRRHYGSIEMFGCTSIASLGIARAALVLRNISNVR